MVRNPDRELREARAAYLGAVRRANAAFLAFDNSDLPLDPGTGPEPHPWTAGHVAILRELTATLRDLIDTRRTWDGMRREHRHPPHG